MLLWVRGGPTGSGDPLLSPHRIDGPGDFWMRNLEKEVPREPLAAGFQSEIVSTFKGVAHLEHASAVIAPSTSWVRTRCPSIRVKMASSVWLSQGNDYSRNAASCMGAFSDTSSSSAAIRSACLPRINPYPTGDVHRPGEWDACALSLLRSTDKA
jgi:hypothetical protein